MEFWKLYYYLHYMQLIILHFDYTDIWFYMVLCYSKQTNSNSCIL